MMRQILISIAVIVVVVGAYIGYSFFRTPEEASAPIEAVPLVLEEESGNSEAESPTSNTDEANIGEASESAAPDTDGSDEATDDTADNGSAEISAGDNAENAAEAQAIDANDGSAATSLAVFEIVQAESQARFTIDEVLRGDPVTVEGITDQVAGQIALNPDDLSSAQIGTILVNARTFTTDNNMRNRAISNRILLTDDNEFITFEPTEIIGLPENGTAGESYAFQVVGDLTIVGSTQQVIFDATVTPTSETRLEGIATTTILYADYGVTIPASQSVDAVEDDLRLEINFVAEAM
ncbi:MAG: YceI family protein [Chloroflexota bacterium]